MLFDLDGTLIDSIRLILDSYHHTMAEHGIPAVAEADWLAGVGTPLRTQLSRWAEGPDHLEAMVQTYRSYNLANHDAMIRVYPGVADMVRGVVGLGIRTGVVTSKTREGTLRGLRLAGLDDAIEIMVCADDVSNPKPHPEPVERALRLLQATPGETVFVGDSVHDMHSGKAAGVGTGAVLWGPFGREALEPAGPDYWLERPAQVLELVRRRR